MAQAVYFIDGRIAPLSRVVSDLPPGAEVHVIDGLSSGWAQMAAVLDGRSGVDAVHVLAHGAPGLLLLGQGTLDQASLSADAAAIAAIGRGLSASADVLLYACEAGRDEAGQAFIAELARLTGADLAASTDATGPLALGGNWALEASTGVIEADVLAGGAGFQGLLDAFNGSGADELLQGGTGDDTLDGGGGNDTLAGGLGDDTYLVDSSTDLVTEIDGEGTDLVISSVDNLSTLGSHVENLALTGALAVYGIGNALNNQIAGSEIANFLVGDAGDDTLLGGNGNDTLRGDAGNDSMVGGDGTDTAHYYLWSAPGGIVFDGAVLGSGATVDIADGEGGIDHLESIENFLVQATTGDDWVSGAEGDDFLVGNSGNDTLLGAGGADLVYGSAGADQIDGGDGDDTLDGGADDDYLAGGSGNDHLSASAGQLNAGHDTLDGGDGDDYLEGGDGDDLLLGGAGADYLIGSTGNDQLDGGDDSDWFDGGAGDDSMIGGSGDDVFQAGDGQDSYSGGDGIDSLAFDAGNFAAPADTTGVWVDLANGVAVDNAGAIDTLDGIEKVYGSELDDTVLGDSNANLLMGHGGDDDLQGLDGDDTLDGGLGDDLLAGGGGNDSIRGGEGSNQLWGGDGNDRLYGHDGSGDNQFDGGAGNDVLQGGAGHDTMAGGTGSDSLYGGAGNDTLDGGAILDRINYTDYNFSSYFSAAAGIDMNLATGVVSDGLGGVDLLSNINIVSGSAHDDRFYGGSEWVFQQFEGGAGNDTIDGGAITDTLNGSNSNRINYVNAGAAVTVSLATGRASGGNGNDVFYNINQVRGSAFGDTLSGSNEAVLTEQFEGRGGNDTIDGAGGNDMVRYENATSGVTVNLVDGTAQDGMGGTDTLRNIEGVRGSAFDDLLIGGAAANGTGVSDGLEFFEGGAGNDSILGGAGYDRVDYGTSITGVVVALGGSANGTAQDGWGGTDTLVNIEAVRGSAYADSLTGSDAAYESFEGREGDDSIDGGGGTDRVDYRGARAGVEVNLGAGTASDGYGGTDTLAGIEEVRGSRDFADRLTGNAEANMLDGLGGDDWLAGGIGCDSLYGGAGNDTMDGGAILDRINYTDFNYTSYSSATAAIDMNLATGVVSDGLGGTDRLYNINIVTGSAYNDRMLGGSEGVFQQFEGGAGNDTIDGGAITDTLHFGNGNRASYANAVAAVSVNLATGIATGGAGTDSLSHINGVRGSAHADTLTGSNDALITEAFEGRAGNDTIDGAGGFDTVRYENATSAVSVNLATGTATDGQGGTDTLRNVEGIRGSAFGDLLVGGAAANGTGSLDGLEYFEGGAGNDSIYGGGGYDRVDYSTSVAGVNVTLGGAARGTAQDGWGGTDTLDSIEAVRGSAFNDTLTGSDGLYESFEGREGNDRIDGGAGTDRADYRNARAGVVANLTLGTASDGQGGTDGLARIEDLRGSRDFADRLTGNGGVNTLDGLGGNDTLDGAAGADLLRGGLGNDLYIVDNAGDRTEEAVGEGTDTVWSGASHTLAANLENLTLTGALAINGIGNTGHNLITGNAAANLLSGSTGNDTLAGGAGGDTYVVDSVGDVVVEATVSPTEIDTVSASVSWALGANLERLVLTGSAALNGSGNALHNLITGNAAANVLTGGAGNDTLIGGTGNDTYYIDAAGDVVIEAGTLASEIDTVSASVSWTLGANLERLVLTGSGAINGSGNGLNNLIVGNAAANVLTGAAGNDTLVGGAGNDTYVVDSLTDVVSETSLTATETDTVNAGVSWTLGANLERLALTGAAAINGTGNVLNNLIAGNAAANVLNGGLGKDTMVGGAGGDTYVVDNTADVIIETGTSSAEVDTVSASVGWVLGAGLERLLLAGSAAINGTGNTLNNQIIGNAAANTLLGGAGNDSLDGGAGNDTLKGGEGNDLLTGGLGADVFVFDVPMSSLRADDRITDFDGRFDRMVLDHNAFVGIGAVGALQDYAWRNGTAAADADDRVIYDASTGRLWYDADGSGSGASILFATLAPNTNFGIEWVSIG